MVCKNKILKAIDEGIKTGFKFNSNQKADNSDIIDFSDSKVNNVESLNIGKFIKAVQDHDWETVLNLYNVLGVKYVINDKEQLKSLFKYLEDTYEYNLPLSWLDISKIDGVSTIKEDLENDDDVNLSYLINQFIKYSHNANNLPKLQIDKILEYHEILGITMKPENRFHMRIILESVDNDANLNWIDVSSITNMSNWFINSKFNGDISEWDVSNVTNMCGMFYDSEFNGDISKWNVSKVNNMCQMFLDSKFNGDISKWSISKGTDTREMFKNCPIEEKHKPICLKPMLEAVRTGFKFSNNQHIDDSSYIDFKDVKVKNAESLNIEKISDDFHDFFFNKDDYESAKYLIETYKDIPFYQHPQEGFQKFIKECLRIFGDDISLNWIDTSNITDISYIFQFSKFRGDMSKWNVSNVENMKGAFWHSSFNGDISKWDVSNVTDMSEMFANADFNNDISGWNTSNVTNMKYMFEESSFNNDISNWDVHNVKDMECMFADCIFNNDISNWDVSNVETMAYMFAMNKRFNQDISKWNVSKVKNMHSMFKRSIFNQDISNWKTNSLENVAYTFENSLFNHDVSKWNVSNVILKENTYGTFDNCPIKPKFRFHIY